MKKVVIVGGVAGGASAAARLRRMDENAQIILLERGGFISYANCGLPYYLGGAIEDRSSLIVQTAEKMQDMFNIEIRLHNEVLQVDPGKKELTVKDLRSGEVYSETYDYLLLSPGAKPIKPPIPGIDSPTIYTLRSIPDTDAIKSFLQEKSPERAVIVGGGYIGLEMAENLHALGIHVTVIEKMDQLIGTMDYDMAALVQGHLLSKGVQLFLNDGVKEFRQEDNKTAVVLESGNIVKGDMVILSIGVRPDVAFLKDSGLEFGERGGIRVSSRMQTSDPSIYAVGDAVEITDFLGGHNTLIPLAGPANKQGRIAANNIAGRDDDYKGTQGTAIAKLFDLTVATTGHNEKLLKMRGVEFLSTVTHAKSHAAYYPGALPMTIKLHYTPQGELLGAQIVGYGGADKTIDVLATALRLKMSVFGLRELELAYAPPYSSAKDPVNIAGYVAENQLQGDMGTAYWHEIDNLDPAKTVVLDVGEEEERELGFIEGSLHIPLPKLRQRIAELSEEKEFIVYCQVGLRAYVAARVLQQKGYNTRVLMGGFKHYKAIKEAQHALVNQNNSPAPGPGFGMGETPGAAAAAAVAQTGATIRLNACGLSCPGPIVEVFKKMQQLSDGATLEVLASDPGFVNDIQAWCAKTGNTLLSSGKEGLVFKALLVKGKTPAPGPGEEIVRGAIPQNKTIVVFSGDLDKAIASFIIANGAAAMGRKVTMFFTFWGLNILRKPAGKAPEKDLLSKMFGWMMPKGSRRLGLSRMNMMGMGPKMIRMVMRKNDIISLEELIEQAQAHGVKLMACNMSMDVMGIKQEELLDGVDIGGVATYLGEAEDANVNLFI